jgi:hypothetical protein
MALNNPVKQREVIDTFREYVQNTANFEIAWTASSKPFSEVPNSVFGPSSVIRTTNLVDGPGPHIITASVINDRLISETNEYVQLRGMRAIKRMLGDGGVTTVIFDETRKAAFSREYLSGRGSLTFITPRATDTQQLVRGFIISRGDNLTFGLLRFFNLMRERYLEVRNNIVTVDITVCHSSCHSSCHNSRTRR